MHDEKLVGAVARERIGRLLGLAYQRTERDPSDMLAARYVRLAREMSSHYKVGMDNSEKNSFCKKCNTMFVPGKTCSVRVSGRNGYSIYGCRCGAERKVFYKSRAV
jgi:ribonuclease P protein subunit RPR2